jgi:hypothetical protein
LPSAVNSLSFLGMASRSGIHFSYLQYLTLGYKAIATINWLYW